MILPETEENPETTNLSVTVTDGTNPVEGANVSIEEITSTTGSAGGCTLQNVPTGSQTIHVTATGYTDYTDTITVSSQDNTITITLEEAQ
ncbi:MAG: carboxypeptidase regulatory-like domain-containing protein [Methanobrevibacter sp.]|nr:carboxypeptidase regulatory-like domain-containing protein [Methanobrevibacter sp.]MBQ6627425.1 carboxypeptidase regulatory-like domain-containing protein [Methanobrevibacter sp.]